MRRSANTPFLSTPKRNTMMSGPLPKPTTVPGRPPDHPPVFELDSETTSIATVFPIMEEPLWLGLKPRMGRNPGEHSPAAGSWGTGATRNELAEAVGAALAN